ncbi:MAG: RecT family recombinase [Akkermansia muciniphila]|nr:recombinase RecT [Akkermansia muciniphila]
MQLVKQTQTVGRQERNAFSLLTEQLGMTSTDELYDIIKNTVMPGAKPCEVAAFALVCANFRLNPLTREVYAFPAKTGGIQPMISIDGWLKLAHQHPDYAGMSWAAGKEDDEVWCECTVFLKSTPEHPVTIREYLVECKRNTEPWRQSPRRMLRHRATIQAIRYALGISGGLDAEEFEAGEAELRNVTPRPLAPAALTPVTVGSGSDAGSAEAGAEVESAAGGAVAGSAGGSAGPVACVAAEEPAAAQGPGSAESVVGAGERLLAGCKAAGTSWAKARRWFVQNGVDATMLPAAPRQEQLDAFSAWFYTQEEFVARAVAAGIIFEKGLL